MKINPIMKPKPKFLGFLLVLTLSWSMAEQSALSVNPNLNTLHLLNRLSFGPRPGDIGRVERMGAERYIQEQLHPDSISESPSLTAQLASLKTINATPLDLFQQVSVPKVTPGEKPTPELRQVYRDVRKQVLEEASQARLLRATESTHQLQEVMTDFWYNHFNVFAGKGVDQILASAYEETSIRPYTLGRFRDLLGATAHHPAMLFYLDNWQNSTPGNPNPRSKKQGINENYARELMELHTLGVQGGYTQQDVVALAKILTGWTFRRVSQADTDRNGFYFDAKRHDFSDKLFLGHTIKGRGIVEGEQALDILAKSPATAHHISTQIAQYFVADQPPKALVDRLSQKFLATDGNIREVLNLLFHSPEFNDPRYFNAKFKTPYQYTVSAVRATGMQVTNVRPIYETLQQLGMPLFRCPTPDGYKNTRDAWLNPDAMTRRISFATALASGNLPLSEPTQGKQSINTIQLVTTLGNPFSANTQQAIAASPPELRAALMLGSPEFMQR